MNNVAYFPNHISIKSHAYVVTSHSGPDARVNTNYSYDIMQKSICMPFKGI